MAKIKCCAENCQNNATTSIECGNKKPINVCQDHWGVAYQQVMDFKTIDETIVVKAVKSDDEDDEEVGQAVNKIFYEDSGPRKIAPSNIVRGLAPDPRRTDPSFRNPQ